MAIFRGGNNKQWATIYKIRMRIESAYVSRYIRATKMSHLRFQVLLQKTKQHPPFTEQDVQGASDMYCILGRSCSALAELVNPQAIGQHVKR